MNGESSMETHTLPYVKQIAIVKSPSHVQLFATPWAAEHQASLSHTISRSLPKFMSIASVMPYNHLILCCLFSLLSSIFPSIRIFSNQSSLCMRWPKYQSFNISPSKEYSGMISGKTDWFDLCAVRGTVKRFLQHRSSKVSILWHSAFFMVQLSQYT